MILLSDEQRFHWLRLIRSENIGPASFRTLLNRYGSAKDALAALPELSGRGGMRRKIKVAPEGEIETELKKARKIGAQFVALGEAAYPPLLRHIHSAPPLICVRGDLAILQKPALAIVGARNASAIGLRLARTMASGVAEAGYAIVSGLARGIDTAAHSAALDSGTIAVLAGGLDIIYPPENKKLYENIGERGLLVSEMGLGFKPRAMDFPRRNRIVSGIASGTLVIEAARRSGSLITARLAREQNREVFAVPGSPADPRAAGTNSLIKQGAALTCSASDILDVLAPINGDLFMQPPARFEDSAERETGLSPAPQANARNRIIDLLGSAPVEMDEIIRLSGEPPANVQIVLLELELAGRIEYHGQQMVSLIS